jgi:Zn-dependent protease
VRFEKDMPMAWQRPDQPPDNVHRLPPRRRPQAEWPISASFLGLTFATLLMAAIMIMTPQYARGAVFPFVVGGWLISLCLHEFGHAWVAHRYGDWTVRDKGYLTLDPIKYADPFNSLLFPLLILALGGIGLPGGAVFIQTNLLRERWHSALVSAAGPMANALFLLLLVAVLSIFGPSLPRELYVSLAFLALLQVTAIAFSLLPVPGFDGWGIIEPWVPYAIREKVQALGPLIPFTVLALFLLVPAVGQTFFSIVYQFLAPLGISPGAAAQGFRLFQFWR